MAAVSEPQEPATAAKLGSRVDEQLAQATTRIRTHDVAFGALALVALTLAYTAAAILLDRYLNLPQWVRQLSLLGFVGTFAGVAYLAIVSPLRKRINPLYAARRVESTIEDSKNSVTGYVDAQEKGALSPTVKAALASRAAKSVAEADVNKAVDHRSLLYLGGVAIALFLTLVVLFFVFRPAQFGSLLTRTFSPFSSGVIKTRTEIDLLKPDPAEPTITDGQTITVAVHIKGKVPSADSPERVRVLVRHNPADPNFTELPMVPGDTSRDYELRVPNYLVQNGFWYKVAAGDAETPEYKVTVRSLPLFTRFQVAYDPPKYMRRPVEVADGAVIKGYRGTNVILTVGTNREVRDGLMVIEPGGAAVKSTPHTEDPTAMHFKFTLQESGKYQVTYTATDGERSPDPFRSVITVLADDAPRVVIDKPEDEEVTIPANGQLAIDGKAGDDFGVDTVTLKMRLTGAAARDLPDVPLLYGKEKSFKRPKDGTFPTDVDVKMSVDFAALRKDATDLPFTPTADMVIEFWLEATDNCAPKANTGKSAVKRVRLTPPPAEEPQQKDQDRQKQERREQENKQNADQKQKLDQERRDQPQNKGGQPPEPKNGEQKKGEDGEGAPKKEDGNPMGGGQTEPKNNDPNKGDANKGAPKTDNNPKGGMNDKGGMPDATNPPQPGTPDKNDNPPKNMGDPQGNPTGPMDPNGGMGQPKTETAPPPKSQDDKDLQNKADKVKDAIKQENENGGTGKPEQTPNAQDRTDPAQAKPQPKAGNMNPGGMGEPQPKPESKPDPMAGANPIQKPDAAPSATKPEGSVEKQPDPSAPKPDAPKPNEPQPGAPKGDDKGAPSEKRNEPAGAPPGADKPQPKDGQPQPKGDAGAKQDPNSGSAAKPAAQEDPGQRPSGSPNPENKPDPAGDAGSRAKPMQEPGRGADKPADPKGKPSGDKPEPKGENKAPDAGDAKPDKAPPAAAPKPTPKDDPMNPGGGMGQPETKPEDKNAQPDKPDGKGGAAEAKPAKPDDKQPTGAGEGVEKGMEKPQPKDGKGQPQGGAGDKNPPPKKLSPEEQKELEDAAKNLTSPDEAKKQDARDKLDKAVGPEKRKELEKLANDLNSPDEKTREAAKQKLDELKKQAQKEADKNGEKGGGPGDKKGGAAKLTEDQKKEVADAVKDLQSDDPQKKKAAQDKLDKMVGEQNRKDAEQLMKDLQSGDKDKKAAAQKKLDDLKKQMEDAQGKKDGAKGDEPKGAGKEPTPEELADLAKKAQDLQSKDDAKRQQAEQELDDKIGKENREKLQKELQNQKPGTPEQEQKLKEEMERMAKDRAKKPHDPKGDGLGTGAPVKEAMEDDARNRLKTAELQLDQFEKKRYDEAFKRKQGFTDAEYEKFLRDYEGYVEKLREDAKRGVAGGEKPPAPGPAEKGPPITAGGAEKIKSRGGDSSSATGGGTTVAPPGFENLKGKFEELLKEKK